MTEHAVKKSRKTFLMVVAAFVLPVILAKLALTQHWFNYGVTNKGQLVEPALAIQDFGLDSEQTNKQWLIIYAVPEHCQSQCQATLYGINNAHIALGKELPRVTPVALAASSRLEGIKQKASSKYWHFFSGIKNQPMADKVWIADPLGNVILSFEPPPSDAHVPDFGKAVVEDLKKLLKYSKIG